MQITNNKTTSSFPNNTVSWEDFLDLSKWRTPVTSAVLERRLFDNLFYFSSNYVWIWFVLSFTWGLWVNWKVLASFIIITIAWFGLLELEKSSSGGNTKTKLDEKNGSKSSSLMMWIIPFSAFIFYVLSALLPIVFTGCLTLIIAGCHSVMRPLVNEALIIQQQMKAREEQKKLISSKKSGIDYGLDSEEREEVVVTFTHNTPKSPNRDELLRAAASKRIWNEKKLATTMSSSTSRTVPYVDISVGDGLHDKPNTK